MLDRLKTFLDRIAPVQEPATPLVPSTARDLDVELASAALLVHVVAVDGVVTAEEEARLRAVLAARHGLDATATEKLVADAREQHDEAVDLYRFTSILKLELDEARRLALVEDLWEMVYADGEVHEMEDNVVWRVAELLGITQAKRIGLKLRVKERALAGDT